MSSSSTTVRSLSCSNADNASGAQNGLTQAGLPDRQGHDRRYSLDCTKLQALGWAPAADFDDGLARTVDWYLRNEWWWRPVKDADPAFRSYYDAQYGTRR